MRRWNAVQLILLAAATAASVSCGSAVRDGSSAVFLVIDTLQGSRGGPQNGTLSGFVLSDVLTNVTSPAPCTVASPCPTVFDDPGTVALRLAPKNLNTTTGPTTNNEVTINRVHIEYVRADGRNTPGVDVPFPFDGATTGTVPATGSLTLGFELVRHTAKMEAPLVQLITSPSILTTLAKVTFWGTDRVGNVVSVSGQIQVNFGNFGDQ
jgi:hypothetical protein